jgi:hypothetical protein
MAQMSKEQMEMVAAAIAFLEKANVVAAGSGGTAPTGHMAEVDATVFQLGKLDPVLDDATLAKLKADLSLNKILPEVLEGVVTAARSVAVQLLAP